MPLKTTTRRGPVREPFPGSAALALGADLNAATHVTDIYGLVARWLPLIVRYDLHNVLIALPAQGMFIRHHSVGFPAGFFDDYADEGAAADLVLKRSIEAGPGQVVHLASLDRATDAPAGWQEYRARKAAQIGLVDSITVILAKDFARGVGAGLTLWRLNPHRRFTGEEVRAVALIGPLWAAAFSRVLSTWSLDGDNAHNAAPAKAALATDVDADGAIVAIDPDQLKTLFGEAPADPSPPLELTRTVAALVHDLERNPCLGFASRDIHCRRGGCHVHVMRAGGRFPYHLTVNRHTAYPDLGPLSREGFTERDIEILDLVQRGGTDQQIAKACGISASAVKKHLVKVANRLGASGRVETLARAYATCRDMELLASLERPKGEQ